MSVTYAVDVANIALQRLGQPTISTLTESSRDAGICNQLYTPVRDWCMLLTEWNCLTNRRVLTRSGKTSITGATKADPVVVSCTGHAFVANELVFIEDVSGMTQLNENTYRVYSATTGTITLYDLDGTTTNGTSFSTWTSGGYVYRDSSPDWTYVYDLPSDCIKPLNILDDAGGELDGVGRHYKWHRERSFIFCDLEYAGLKYVKKETDPSVYTDDLIEVMAARMAWYISMRVHSDKTLRNEIYTEMQQSILKAKMLNASGGDDEGQAETLWVDVR